MGTFDWVVWALWTGLCKQEGVRFTVPGQNRGLSLKRDEMGSQDELGLAGTEMPQQARQELSWQID